MRLQQLRAQAAALAASMQATANLASTRALTEDEKTKFETDKAAHEAVKAEIASLEAMQAAARDAGAASPLPVNGNQAAAEAAAAAAGVRVQVGAHNSEKDTKRGFSTPREFLMAVMAAGRGIRDPRLEPLRARDTMAAVGSDEHGTYSAPNGGFLVPEGFSPELLQLMPEDDPAAPLTRKVTLGAPIVKFNARVDKNHSTSVSGGLTVSRRPETVAPGSSRMEFEKITMAASSLFGLAYATEELITDSPQSFMDLLAGGFSQEIGAHLAGERFTGTGVGEFEGINNSPALISVAKEGGQAADTINYENVKKMRARVWGYGRAVWHANHDTLPELMSLVQVVGTGGVPVYQPSARDGEPDRLLGRPIYYTEYVDKLGDAGDLVCVNWGEYLEGTYQPLQSAESIHVRFVEHERTFKVWLRNDGRGWWRSVLTPKNGAATLSPFVRLAERA